VNRRRLVATLFGVAFGFLLSWGRLTDPDVIRSMLQLEEAYVFLMMGSAVAVGLLGVHLLTRRPRRALLTREPLAVRREPVARRHVAGAALFGFGWAVADTCPGPIAAQLGQALPWALCTAAGVTGGVLLFQVQRRRARAASGARVPARSAPGAA
jgi:uncharacterized membrane protein YedE/YeeE